MKNNTIEVRWHGRGGQGAVTSAELLALAAINEGKYAQAMPSFGPERRGAPVLAFNRVNNTNPILMRVGVLRPDIVVVLDPGLLEIIDITAGLKESGTIIINSNKNINEIKSQFSGNWKLAVVDATSIAKEIVGVPIVNTTMLGALIKTTEIIKLDSDTNQLIFMAPFTWVSKTDDRFECSKASKVLNMIRQQNDWSEEHLNQELENRKTVLEWMLTKNIRSYKDIGRIVSQYKKFPDLYLKKAKEELGR